MSNRERATRFTQYVGMELKGQIAARGWTAQAVAQASGRSASALNRWLNGKQEIPLTVLAETAELIGVEPTRIVENAYGRMIMVFGELDGTQYDEADRAFAESSRLSMEVTPEEHAEARATVTPVAEDEETDIDITSEVRSAYDSAAHRGQRKSDVPYAE